MSLIQHIKDVFPIPKTWENNDDLRQFGVRINDRIREIYSKLSSLKPVNNLVTKDAGYVLDARQGRSLRLSIERIGTIVTGTVKSSLTVASGTWTEVATISLNAGTWLLMGHAGYDSSFDSAVGIEFRTTGHVQNSIVRGNGLSGGALITTYVVTVSSSAAPFDMSLAVIQSSGSNKTASNVQFRAICLS